VSMTVAKHCVSRRWIVPFLEGRIHYLAARRPSMIRHFSPHPISCPRPTRLALGRLVLKPVEGRLLSVDIAAVSQLIAEGDFQHVLRRALQDKVRSTA